MERPKPAWMAQRRMREDEQLTRIRAALARPQSYPHRPARVELRETHISWVFLAGERAYKLKKPLVLDFLDYGTRARRRLMCEREVELNRVLAPDIHLGVRGVAPAGEGIVLTSPDDPRAIEHLVEMQRFDERDTLAARLRRGALCDGELTAVARALARFHAGAARAPAPRAPELDAELRFEREVHELAELAGEREELTRLLALARFADAFIAARGETIAARAASGSVRDGHGDLRAEHVLLDGRIRIVDRIEFDSALRALDVGDDLAFLHFDLAAAGAWHLAELLLRRYREAGGDPGEDWLIAFYAARHALIRAKVALVRATQQREDHAAAERARRLITLAERFAWRARLPLAIILAGLPASGKSHLARELAHRSGLAQVSSPIWYASGLRGFQPPAARPPRCTPAAGASAPTPSWRGRPRISSPSAAA